MTPMEGIIVQGDFAENYSYVVQDEIQRFHWENKQATLHPFVAYQRQEDNTLQHRNILCVISDCKDHNDSNCFCISEGCPKIFEDRDSSCYENSLLH